MTRLDARVEAPPTPTVVDVGGALDAHAARAFRRRLQAAVEAGNPILVDLGDCTFVDAAGARLLAQAHQSATQAKVSLRVVLPVSSASPVRRMLLEFAPDLVSFPIVARRSSTPTPTSPTSGGQEFAAVASGRIHELRADLWEAGSRRDQLLADRDALILRQREALATYRESKARRGKRI